MWNGKGNLSVDGPKKVDSCRTADDGTINQSASRPQNSWVQISQGLQAHSVKFGPNTPAAAQPMGTYDRSLVVQSPLNSQCYPPAKSKRSLKILPGESKPDNHWSCLNMGAVVVLRLRWSRCILTMPRLQNHCASKLQAFFYQLTTERNPNPISQNLYYY